MRSAMGAVGGGGALEGQNDFLRHRPPEGYESFTGVSGFADWIATGVTAGYTQC